MTPVGMETAKLSPTQQVKPQATGPDTNAGQAPLKVEQNKVTLSDEGKALLAALQEIEKDSKAVQEGDKTVSDKVESFAHGALGMDHPDKIKEEDDGSYSAGQYLSAAATIGGILLAIL
jgi:prophage DNA circulation protein